MKSQILFFAFALAFTACNSNQPLSDNSGKNTVATQENGTSRTVKTISPAEAKTLLETEKEVIILDVRTPAEYAAGHLKNAMLLNKYDPDFEAKVQALDKTKTYLVYCASGGRSGQTLQLMDQAGFEQVFDAKGFKDLKNAGLPVE